MTVMALYTKGEEQDCQQITKLDDIISESILYNCSAHVEREEGKLVPKGNVTE